MAEWPCCHDPLRSSPTLHRFRPHLFPCKTSMPFSPLSLQSPCLVSTGNSGLPSFGGGSTAGKQASVGEGGEPRISPKNPAGNYGFPGPPTLFPDGIGAGCGEIRDSPDALPKRNWCARVQGNSGFPRPPSLTELVQVRGNSGFPRPPSRTELVQVRGNSGFPRPPSRTELVQVRGNSGFPCLSIRNPRQVYEIPRYICPDETRGKPRRFGVPRYICPDETRGKPRRFGVPQYICPDETRAKPRRFGVPRYICPDEIRATLGDMEIRGPPVYVRTEFVRV